MKFEHNPCKASFCTFLNTLLTTLPAVTQDESTTATSRCWSYDSQAFGSWLWAQGTRLHVSCVTFSPVGTYPPRSRGTKCLHRNCKNPLPNTSQKKSFCSVIAVVMEGWRAIRKGTVKEDFPEEMFEIWSERPKEKSKTEGRTWEFKNWLLAESTIKEGW